MQFDKVYLKSLVSFTSERKEELIKFFAKQQNEEVILEAFRLMLENVKKLNGKAGRASENHLAGFYIALDAMKGLEEGRSRKGPVMTKEKAALQERVRISRIRGRKERSSEVKNRIEKQFYHLIRRLRGEGLSWRQISEYLARHNRFNVYFTYLRTTFTEIEKARSLASRKE